MRSKMRIMVLLICASAFGAVLGFCVASYTWKNELRQSVADSGRLAPVPATGSIMSVQAFTPTARDVDLIDIEHAMQDRNFRQRRVALARIADSISLADISKVLPRLNQRREPEILRLFRQLLVRWAQSDPVAALSFVRSELRLSNRSDYMQTVLREWATDAVSDALRWAKDLSPGHERDLALAAVLGTAAEQDPQHALALLNDVSGTSNKRSLRRIILQKWARNDPITAAQAVTKLEGTDVETLGDIAVQLASEDPQAALRWVQRLGSIQTRNKLLPQVVDAWAQTNPKAAADFVLSQAHGQCQEEMLEALAHQWASLDLPAAIGWATNLPPGSVRTQILAKILENGADIAPETVASYVSLLQESRESREALGVIAERWALKDPERTKTWVQGLPLFTQSEVIPQLISRIAGNDPALGVDITMSLSNRPVRTKAILALATEWSKSDFSAAASWLRDLPDFPYKAAALRNVLHEWAINDPEQAAAEPVDLLPANMRDNFRMDLARQWAATDPQAVIAWEQQLPEGANRTQILTEILKTWATHSPVDAATFAATLTSGANPNSVVLGVVSSWAQVDPVSAASWVSLFPAGKGRDEAAFHLITTWKDRDMESQGAWLDSLAPSTDEAETAPLEQLKIVLARRWLAFDEDGAREWIRRSTLNEDVKRELLKQTDTP